mgnify:CR=1 FL=1
MASTYSDRLRIELMAAGDQSGTWGDTTNTNLGTLIEEAIAGFSEITMSDANKTLSANNGATDEARQMILKFSGGSLTATRDIIIPSKEKLYVIHNATSGSQSIRIKTASSSSTVTIANGKTTVVYCDATDVFLAITNVPASNLSGTVAIANGGTGLTSAGSSGNVNVSNGSAFVSTAGAITPAGAIITFGGTSAPTGYLACDGTAVSRTTYSALFTAISTTWGVGDGSSTFNLPDLRAAFLRGAGTQTYTNAYDGGSVGAKSVDKLRKHGHKIMTRRSSSVSTPDGLINNVDFAGIDDYRDTFPDNSVRPNIYGAANREQIGGNLEDKFIINEPQGEWDPSTKLPAATPTTGDEGVPFNATVLYCIKT